MGISSLFRKKERQVSDLDRFVESLENLGYAAESSVDGLFPDRVPILDVPTAVAALSPGDKTMVVRGITSLALLKAAEAVGPLIAILAAPKGYDCEERSIAIIALGHIGNPRAVDPLLQILHMSRREEQDRLFVWEREKAVKALGMIGDAKAFDPICEELKNPKDSGVGEKAIEALFLIDPQRALPPLIDALDHWTKWWQLRRQAAYFLGKIGDRRALAPLSRMAERDVDGMLKLTALDAIKRIKALNPKAEENKE